MHVAIVMDDDETAVTAVSRWMEKLGYRVFSATTIPDALAVAYLFKADVVIADWYVGEHTGDELLAAIHSLCPDSRRVVLSSHSREEAGYEGDLVDMWLRKPMSAATLKSVIGKVA